MPSKNSWRKPKDRKNAYSRLRKEVSMLAKAGNVRPDEAKKLINWLASDDIELLRPEANDPELKPTEFTPEPASENPTE